MGLNETALLRLQVTAGNGGEINVEASGQLALRRQAIGRSEAPAADVFGDSIGNGEVARLIASGEVRHPVLHYSKRSSESHARRMQDPVNEQTSYD
jgi:hypothetical protein